MNEDFYISPPSHGERWRGVELSDVQIASATKTCAETFEMANHIHEVGNYSHVCIHGEPVFYYDFPYALIPGHIYSDIGMDEFRISQWCEYHFDHMFGEDDG